MNCLHCNKPIEGKRNTKKYCSNTCKQYAYLNRSFNSSPNLEEMRLDLGISDNVVQSEKQQLITIKTEQHEEKELIKNKTQEIVVQEKENDLEGYKYLHIRDCIVSHRKRREFLGRFGRFLAMKKYRDDSGRIGGDYGYFL